MSEQTALTGFINMIILHAYLVNNWHINEGSDIRQ